MRQLRSAPHDAVAGLRTADDNRARARRESLAIQAQCPGAHYVRARVNEKAGKQDEALADYRLALKSEPADANAPCRLLTAYYLSNLLFENGYYTAGIEQAGAFEAGLNALGDKAGEDPELAALARAHRQTSIIRTARAYGLLGTTIAPPPS
jgi:tetratricopeptide (TPR) repeat protein